MTVFIDYSIGPVQGFVAQSRRTRDLWGSSYLLSFLAGHAMLGATRAGGEVVRPKIKDDPLFLWISGSAAGDAPIVGSLPNRFQIEVRDGDNVHDIANAATEAFQDAWNRVHRTVWDQFASNVVFYGRGTEEIWSRQTGHFWEILWTAGPHRSSRTLARRKSWRTHRLTDEPGDKCTVMHDLQELSGYVRAKSQDEAHRQDEFWQHLRSSLRPSDLCDDERLCSIALVKRLFPIVAREALGWEVDTSHWPSTVYIAAVPWIRKVLSRSPSVAAEYASLAREVATSPPLTERCPSFDGLHGEIGNGFAMLDANYFHEAYVQNSRLCPLREGARSALLRALESLQQTESPDGTHIGSAPNYYALLLADGDRVGSLSRDIGSEAVGNGLLVFSKVVPDIVRQHDGVTIYDGGDDVLAMLPVPTALKCARKLSEEYARAFDGVAQATLSASVVFAHMRLALTSVIIEAHRLLDLQAKEANGRNSLAVAIRNRGGPTCEWTTTWTRESRSRPGVSLDSVNLVERVSHALAEDPSRSEISTSLLYKLREVLALLTDRPCWKPGEEMSLPADLDGYCFIRAEVMRTFADREDTQKPSGAEEMAQLIWDILQTARNSVRTSGSSHATVTVDGLLLARFLARGGCEEDVR